MDAVAGAPAPLKACVIFLRDSMSRSIYIAIVCLLSSGAFASLPIEVSILQVVKDSDHILTIQIVDVEMIDSNGSQITDTEAMTGPGLENTIRLICEVLEAHRTNSSDVPKTIKIPLDNNMHYSLGQIKQAHKIPYPMLAVLKGKNFKPAYAGIFQYPLYELETLLALYNLKN